MDLIDPAGEVDGQGSSIVSDVEAGPETLGQTELEKAAGRLGVKPLLVEIQVGRHPERGFR